MKLDGQWTIIEFADGQTIAIRGEPERAATLMRRYSFLRQKEVIRARNRGDFEAPDETVVICL